MMTICGEIDCEGCLVKYANDISLCKAKGKQRDKNKLFESKTLDFGREMIKSSKTNISAPKVIARISFCGALTLNVTEDMDWTPPTPEQIKNLKEMLNIDVILMGDKDDN